MAASCARSTLQIFSGSAKSVFLRSSSSSPLSVKAAKLSGVSSARPTSASRFSVQKLSLFRLPVQLGSVQSLLPLHSVTASALFTSLLSLHNDTWGCLSEGFATPL